MKSELKKPEKKNIKIIEKIVKNPQKKVIQLNYNKNDMRKYMNTVPEYRKKNEFDDKIKELNKNKDIQYKYLDNGNEKTFRQKKKIKNDKKIKIKDFVQIFISSIKEIKDYSIYSIYYFKNDSLRNSTRSINNTTYIRTILIAVSESIKVEHSGNNLNFNFFYTDCYICDFLNGKKNTDYYSDLLLKIKSQISEREGLVTFSIINSKDLRKVNKYNESIMLIKELKDKLDETKAITKSKVIK